MQSFENDSANDRYGGLKRIVVTAATPPVEVGPTLVRTIANLAFDRNEETPPFAGGRGEFVTLLGGRLRWRLCRPRRLGLGTGLAP